VQAQQAIQPRVFGVQVPTHGSRDGESGIVSVLDQAMTNPTLLGQLAGDVVGTLHELRVRVSADDLKRMLGIAGATDVELVETLRTRISRGRGADCGCGGTDD
jgi:hypothetical protein